MFAPRRVGVSIHRPILPNPRIAGVLWTVLTTGVMLLVLGVTLVAWVPRADALTPGIGDGPDFCSTVPPSGETSGYDLGANYDDVWACGPTPGSSQPGYGDAFEESLYGFQCTELADRFLWDAWGMEPVFGPNLDGENFAAAVHSAYPRVPLVPNGTAGQPYLPGDVVSFSGDGEGHVAVVIASTENTKGSGEVMVMEENAATNVAPRGEEALTVSGWSLEKNPEAAVTPLDFDALANPSAPPPTVTDVEANPPSLGSAAGQVTVSADVQHGSTCVLAASPAVAGLPTTVPCTDEDFSRAVSVPANTSSKIAKYKLTLTADYWSVGKVKAVKAKPVTVSVAAHGGSAVPQERVAAGSHSCAVISERVYCWGENGWGQLGVDTSTGPENCAGEPCSTRPLEVHGITNATQVTVNASDSCALLSTGEIECWGYDGDGELGNGTTEGPQICHDGNNNACETTPVRVATINNATQVATASNSTCALLSTGGVDCWGTNALGALGDNSYDESATPVSVHGISTAVQVAANYGNACAVLSDGHVECWGINSYGVLGNGTSTPESCDGNACSYTPVPVQGITNATHVSVGWDEACAVLSTGGVDCWGQDMNGELGNGTTVGYDPCFPNVQCTTVAAQVTGLSDAASVTAGYEDVCSLLSTGKGECWGVNAFGALGIGRTTGPELCSDTTAPCSTMPVVVKHLPKAKELAGGGGQADAYCASLQAGALDCWGYNELGGLGNGVTTNRGSPVPVQGLP
jgi:alpha-tubulin suppressor-like RCC1 family protein